MLIFDSIPLPQVNGFVRETFNLEAQRNHWELLDLLCPVVETEDTELEAVVGSLVDESEAKIRAWDTEAEIRGRQGFSKTRFELPPISIKYPIGEKETLDVARMRRVSGDATFLVNAIYADGERGARAIAARWARLRASALWDAGITLDETNDRVIQSISYGRTGSHTVTASILWTVGNASTSVPITDLQAWISTYIATNGFPPGAIACSSAVLAGMLASAQIKTMLNVPSGVPVTVPALMALLDAYGIPPFVAFDANTRRGGSVTRLTPSNKILMVPSLSQPVGNFYVGPTAEAGALIGAGAISADGAPGLSVVVDQESDPYRKTTRVNGTGLPWIALPNQTFLATVQ